MRTTLSVVVLVLLALTAPHLRAAPPNPDAPSVAGKLVGPEKLDEKLCKTFRVRAYQKDESKSRRGREGFTALECKSSLTTSGGFEIRELPECQCQLWAELDGWISEPLDLLVPANGKVFNMRAAGKIKVGLDFKGMPPAVQDASLRVAVKESKNFELDPTNTKVWQLAADAVLIDVNIPSGNCELFLHWGSDPDSFSPEALRFTPEPATFKLGSGETREVRLSCEPCARLTLIEEGGRSVSPSHVVLTNDGKKPPFRGSSQQGGTLSLYQLLAGKYTMKINMPHYEPYAAEVVLKAGEICTHEYKLKPTADNKLTGTVVDDKGKPVAGAELRVGATGATSVSDKDGRFTVNEPYAGGSFDTIYVMADGFEEEWYKPQGADVQIKLRRATMIHGSIKGGAGMRVQVAVYKTYPGDSDDYDNKLEFGLSKPDGSYALTLLSSFRGAIPQSADVVLTHGTTVIVKHIEGLAKGMWVGVDFELPAGGLGYGRPET
ncbi:MAG: carboxypeptidase regulatory-like domain-containing protein, partial [Planctomycetes bacterium]|nr:carboxypeptidase regulatory-like domain-containing protein [Planctomycetota bacterium]